MARAVLITGGNMGDVEQSIASAREMVSQRVGRIESMSSVRSSRAWGEMEGKGGEFLNQVLVVETGLEPMELLDTTQDIERKLGRIEKNSRSEKQKYHYLSRIIDIDILYYDELTINTERLQIPHPLISEREFVLVLLEEVMPHYKDPANGMKVGEMIKSLRTKTE